jgi:hypothetical protein
VDSDTINGSVGRRHRRRTQVEVIEFDRGRKFRRGHDIHRSRRAGERSSFGAGDAVIGVGESGWPGYSDHAAAGRAAIA